MARGGERTGRPGVAYPNRGDLTGKRVYGDGRTDEAVRTSTPNTAPARTAPAPGPSAGPPPPGSLGTLTGPSSRPDEPVTAGLPIGAGPGPDALTPTPAHDQALWELRALVDRYPDDRDLMRMIALAEQRL